MKKISVIVFVLLTTVSYTQTRQLDSLKKVLPTVTGKARLEVLFALSNQLEAIFPKEALGYGSEGVSLALQVGDSTSLATLYSSLAFSSSELGNFDQSLKYGYQSLDISTLIQNKKKIASANSTLGITYVYIGQYSKALEHHLEALRIREELGLVVPTAATLNNIGIVYHNIGQYDKAIEYYHRAQTLHGATISELGKVHYLVNIGYSEFKRGNYEVAMKYHTDALVVAKKYNYKGILAYIYFNLGIMHSEKMEYEKAIGYLHNALQNYKELGQKYGMVQLLNALGTTYYKTSQYGKSKHYLDSAIIMARQINAPDQLKTSYETLYSIYDKTGPMSKAYQYYRLYSKAKDSLMDSNESKKIADIVINHEIAQKQRVIELLKKEKVIADLSLEKQSLQSKALYGSILLSVFIISFLIFNGVKIHKNNKIVEQKNEELRSLNDELSRKVSEIQLLSGLLPICANCKKIRDDKGTWEQLERYITKHSEATFSHGICPDCVKALYGEAYVNRKDTTT